MEKINKSIKIGTLAIILVMPIFVLLFFTLFGETKHKKLPIYNPQVVDCEPNLEGDTAHHVPAFQFIDQDKNAFSLQNMRGKIMVVDFIFTTCPTICKTMSAEMLRVQEAFNNNPDVELLSHTVDPVRDSAEVLKEYAQRYGANTQKWHFLTGEKAAIYKMARCGYFVSVTQGDGGENDFIHTEKLVLIDKEGRIRGYYSGIEKKDVDRLITEIQLLMKEYKENS